MATFNNFSTAFIPYAVPDSTTQSSSGASYTVPSGYFAVATVNVHAGETFAINGTTVLTSSDVTSTWSTMTSNVSPRVFTGSNVNVVGSVNAKGMYTHLGGGGGTGTFTSPVDQGDMFSNATATARARTSVTGKFRLKAGDYISGARYHVETYKIPA